MKHQEHPLFEIVTTTAGAISIRNKQVNEIMHNPVGPWVEANALYIDQSHLRERLTEANEEFVIFDVGLGAAANSLAALACIRSLGSKSRPVRIVSFERELELLRFALKHSSEFAHFSGFESAIQNILDQGFWESNNITWELRQGDFLDSILREEEKPHLVFFDPYSPKVNEDMWTIECFKRIRNVSREVEEGGTVLFTYSRATRIRSALITAGFFVGYGQATGLKDETTQAATDLELLDSPVGKEWFERWDKSHLKYPFDCDEQSRAVVDQAIKNYRSSWIDFKPSS